MLAFHSFAEAILDFAGLDTGSLALNISGTPRTEEYLRQAEFGDDSAPFDDAGADGEDGQLPTIDPYAEDDNRDTTEATEDKRRPSSRGRRLLEFHGNRKSLQVKVGHEFSWIQLWKETVDLKSEACQHMIRSLEDEVNFFGYSLKNLTWYESPKAFRGSMFDPLMDL